MWVRRSLAAIPPVYDAFLSMGEVDMTCSNCGADLAGAGVCSSCGQAPAPAQAQEPAPVGAQVNPFGEAPPEPSRAKKAGRGGAGLLLRFLIPILILGGAYIPRLYRSLIGSGDYTQVDELAIGDCFDLFDSSENGESIEIEGADVLDCTVDHTFQIVGKDQFVGVTEYSDDLFETAWNDCAGIVSSVVDLDAIPEALLLDTFIPTNASWSDGDRGYLCYVYLEDESPMTRSWVLAP